jgi:putative tryptophan/tyrosine transport system substrate-binding protein
VGRERVRYGPSRRGVVAGLGAALARPVAGLAQQTERSKLLAILMNASETDPVAKAQMDSFSEALRNLGWTDRMLRIERRWSAGDPERARAYAAELAALVPDVIFTSSSLNLAAVRHATGVIPIVFASVSDPVGQGFVSSFAQPGGNITGFSLYDPPIAGKWLGLLKEIAPSLARVELMFRPESSPQSQFFLRALAEAAPSLGVTTGPAPIHEVADIEPAIARLAGPANGGLILPTDSFVALHHQLIVDLAIRYRAPTLSTYGGDALMSYTAPALDQFPMAAGYVDRILKGAKPADLPVQAPTRFQFVINLKTAKALGLTVPLTLQLSADQVIE